MDKKFSDIPDPLLLPQNSINPLLIGPEKSINLVLEFSAEEYAGLKQLAANYQSGAFQLILGVLCFYFTKINNYKSENCWYNSRVDNFLN